MRKKELLTICCLQATRKMLKFAKKEEKRYRKQRVQKKMQQFDREVYVRICKKGEILAVSFFRVKEMLDKQIQPELVVFLNKKECTYLSYIPREAKWRTATIMNIIGYSHWNFYHCTKRDWALFRKYFDTECSRWTPLKVSAIRSIIQEFQTDILWDKIEERRRQETDEWDQVMSQIPALPKDWERWCRKSVITQHYIFYKPERKGEGYCSRCNTRVQGISPKHNQYGICPKCRQRIQYKSMKMQKRIIPKAEHTYLLQKFGVDQMVIRKFAVYANFHQNNGFIPEISWLETRRVIVEEDFSQTAYYYGKYKDDSYRWRESLYAYYHYDFEGNKGTIYQRTLFSLNQGILKKSGLYEFQKNMRMVEPETYLLYRYNCPAIEKVAKAGLKKIVVQSIQRKSQLPNYKKLVEILGINSCLLKQLVKVDGGRSSLSWLQKMKDTQKWIPENILQYFETHNISTTDVTFIEKQMSPQQIYHYLRRMEKESGLSAEKVLTIWRDYLSMVKKLGKNLEDSIIYRPRALERRHDEAVIALQEIDTKQRAEELREKFPNLEKVCREITPIYQSLKDEKYAVLVPQKIEDIIKEGKALHHCVGTQEWYFDRISRKASYIVFLRRQENLEKEFYTMEIEPNGNVVQKSKEYNRTGEDYEEAEIFLKKWKKNVLKKIEKQEKVPEKPQVTLWTAELSAAYKDHVVIKGGKHQGQYLTDVLEAEQRTAA